MTKLHEAARNGDLNAVKELSKGYNFSLISASEGCGRETPLHWAASWGHLNVVRYFIEKCEVNPNLGDENVQTPLHYAAEDGHLNVVRYLVEECEIDPNIIRDDGGTALHWAAKGGKLKVVRHLIEKHKVNRNIIDGWGRTPLQWAAKHKHLHVVRYLVDAKADIAPEDLCREMGVNFIEDYEIRSFLWHHIHPDLPIISDNRLHLVRQLGSAAGEGNLKRVKELINGSLFSRGIPAGSHDGNLFTALHEAAASGHLEVVCYLMKECKMEPDIISSNNLTPLHLAVENRHLKIVSYLIENRADPNINVKHRTPLHLAVDRGYFEIVSYLVENGAVPSIGLKYNARTPLDLAVLYNNSYMAYYLIKKANRIYTNDGTTLFSYDGNTVLEDNIVLLKLLRDSAFSSNQKDIVCDLIYKCQVNPNITDKNSNTTLHWIIQADYNSKEKCLNAIQCLIEAKADPNLANADGNTPLHLAAEKIFSRFEKEESIHIVRYLVEQGKADVTLKNKAGKTALDIAKDEEVRNFLEPILASQLQQKAQLASQMPIHVNSISPNQPVLGSTLSIKMDVNNNSNDNPILANVDLNIEEQQRDTQKHTDQLASESQLVFSSPPPNVESEIQNIPSTASNTSPSITQNQALLSQVSDENAKPLNVDINNNNAKTLSSSESVQEYAPEVPMVSNPSKEVTSINSKLSLLSQDKKTNQEETASDIYQELARIQYTPTEQKQEWNEDVQERMTKEYQQLSEQIAKQQFLQQKLAEQQNQLLANAGQETAIAELNQRVISINQNCQILITQQKKREQILRQITGFKQQPNLFLFFHQFYMSLENFLNAAKSFGTGIGKIGTRQDLGKTALGADVIAQLLSLIPCIGNSIGGLISSAAQAAATVDRIRQINALRAISKLGTADELKEVVEKTACLVTQIYAPFIAMLLTEEALVAQSNDAEQSFSSYMRSTTKRAVQSTKQAITQEQSNGQVERLAGYGVSLISAALMDGAIFGSNRDTNTLPERFVAILAEAPSNAKTIKNSLYNYVGIHTVKSQQGEWSMQAIFCKSVKIETPVQQVSIATPSAPAPVLPTKIKTVDHKAPELVTKKLAEKEELQAVKQHVASLQEQHQIEMERIRKEHAEELAQLNREQQAQAEQFRQMQKQFEIFMKQQPNSEKEVEVGDSTQMMLLKQQHASKNNSSQPSYVVRQEKMEQTLALLGEKVIQAGERLDSLEKEFEQIPSSSHIQKNNLSFNSGKLTSSISVSAKNKVLNKSTYEAPQDVQQLQSFGYSRS